MKGSLVKALSRSEGVGPLTGSLSPRPVRVRTRIRVRVGPGGQRTVKALRTTGSGNNSTDLEDNGPREQRYGPGGQRA